MSDIAPKLAVIIPTYNRGELLRRAVTSAQQQSLKDLEIVICDDCSTDNTKEVVAILAAHDTRVRYVRTLANSGPAVARNLGILSTSANYITTLDSDDIYLSNEKLEKELDAAIRNSTSNRAAIGFSRRVLLDADLKPLPRHLQPSRPIKEGNILAPLLSRSLEIPRDFTFPKNLYFEVGGYDPAVGLYEDWDLKIRMAQKANFYFTGIDGTGYVKHAAGLSASPTAEHQTWLSHVFSKNIGLLDADSQADATAKFLQFSSALGWNCRAGAPPKITEHQRLGEGLIFLISLPRSGSTLVQRMIASHSAIYTHSESWLMLPALCARRSDIIFAEYNHQTASRATADFILDLPATEESYRYWLRTCYAGLYQECLRSKKVTYYLDKTPRYYLIAPELIDLFPRAKFILLWRHPLDALRSMYERSNNDLNNFYHWVVDVREGLSSLHHLQQSGRALEVYYEDIVASPESEMRRISSYLGIEFESSMLTDLCDNDAGNWRFGDKNSVKSASTPIVDSVGLWSGAIHEQPGFAALADGFLKINARPINRLRYDFDEMRRVVPRINCTKVDELFQSSGDSYSRQFIAKRALPEIWSARLSQLGPISYTFGRFVWNLYKRIARAKIV